jgi:hypothetical protein
MQALKLEKFPFLGRFINEKTTMKVSFTLTTKTAEEKVGAAHLLTL